MFLPAALYMHIASYVDVCVCTPTAPRNPPTFWVDLGALFDEHGAPFRAEDDVVGGAVVPAENTEGRLGPRDLPRGHSVCARACVRARYEQRWRCVQMRVAVVVHNINTGRTSA